MSTSPQPHQPVAHHQQRPRPTRHPLAVSAPAPLTQQPAVPSTPPPSYTPKDPFAPPDDVGGGTSGGVGGAIVGISGGSTSSFHYQHQAAAAYSSHALPPQPLMAMSASSAPTSRRSSNPAIAAAMPAFTAVHQQHQQHAASVQQHASAAQQQQQRRRSSAAARLAAAQQAGTAASPAPGGHGHGHRRSSSAAGLNAAAAAAAMADPNNSGNGNPSASSSANNTSSSQSPASPAAEEPPSSALHPRVAVLLGIKESFHVPLLLCRALATAPAVWWFGKCGVLWVRLGLRYYANEVAAAAAARGVGAAGAGAVEWGAAVGSGPGAWGGVGDAGAGREGDVLVLTEVFLAMLWCTASGYLSFYFADCLMSRWLLNYTPSATLVRLFTISVINVYTTSWWLHLSGASRDPRLLLPAWICIASTLTILYHVTHRHVNIRRETRAAVRAFWLTSTVSLWLLLLQSHIARATWRDVPLVGVVRRVVGAWRDAKNSGGLGVAGEL